MRILIFSLASVLLAGCEATVDYAPEAAFKTGQATGIRYYENSPYVIAYSNGKGGLNWQLMYLPDQTKLMVATPKVIGGHTEMTMFFHNGVLAGASSVGDTTQLPKAVISAIQSAIPLLASNLDTPKVNEFPPPYIFKVVVSGDEIKFYSAKGDVGVRVPAPTTTN